MSSNFRSWEWGRGSSTVSTWLPSYLSHASYYQNTWTQHVSDALKETSHAKNLNEQENISGVFIAKMENRFCKTHPTEKSLVDRSVLIINFIWDWNREWLANNPVFLLYLLLQICSDIQANKRPSSYQNLPSSEDS